MKYGHGEEIWGKRGRIPEMGKPRSKDEGLIVAVGAGRSEQEQVSEKVDDSPSSNRESVKKMAETPAAAVRKGLGVQPKRKPGWKAGNWGDTIFIRSLNF